MAKKEAAEAWLKYAIKNIRERIKKLKVEDTGELYRSIDGAVQELSGGDSYKAEILYNYYGIFPDRGAGRGQTADEVSVNKLAGSGRKRKPWTKAITRESRSFGEVMQKVFADELTDGVLKKIPGNITMEL